MFFSRWWSETWRKLRVFLKQILPPTLLSRTLLLILLAAGIFLRVSGLTWGIPDRENQSSVYHDEGHVLGYVLYDWESFKREFGEYEIVRPVFLFRIIGRPLFTLGDHFGWNDPGTRIYELAILRSITALFGILGLIGIYLLGQKVFSYQTGLIALSLLVFMPGHWYYSQILKGDLIVATVFTFLLLGAIRIAERGDKAGYLLSGVTFGAGVALKATTIIAAPLLLAAHLWFVWRRRNWRLLISLPSILFLGTTILSFFLLYPYPFIDFERLRSLFANPSIQHFSIKVFVPPSEYIRVWSEYNLPTRPFAEMIYGKFLLWPLMFFAVLVLVLAFYRLIKIRDVRLLLIIILAALFGHSLTFSAPLDERYLLPSSIFAALFPALLLTGAGFSFPRWLRGAGGIVAVLLIAGTAAITWKTFPSFAFNNPREQALEWIEQHAQPKDIIAQPSQLSRWALPFNRDKYVVASIAHGPEGDRYTSPLVTADYLLLQRDPWNYDHTFRYELEKIGDQISVLTNRFQEKKTFGKVPSIFGLRIPQNLGTPVIEVFSKQSPLPFDRNLSLESQRALQNGSVASLLTMDAASLEHTYVTGDLRVHTTQIEKDAPRAFIGISVNNAVLPALDEMPPSHEPTAVVTGAGPILLLPVHLKNPPEEPQRISFALEFTGKNQVILYGGENGNFMHSGRSSFQGESIKINLFTFIPESDLPWGTVTVNSVRTGHLP